MKIPTITILLRALRLLAQHEALLRQEGTRTEAQADEAQAVAEDLQSAIEDLSRVPAVAVVTARPAVDPVPLTPVPGGPARAEQLLAQAEAELAEIRRVASAREGQSALEAVRSLHQLGKNGWRLAQELQAVLARVLPPAAPGAGEATGHVAAGSEVARG